MRTHQDAIARFWDSRPGASDQAAYHGLRAQGEKDAWLATLRSLVGEQPLDVLDAGTGTGFLDLLLAETAIVSSASISPKGCSLRRGRRRVP